MKRKITIIVLGLLVSFFSTQAQNWVQIGEDINGAEDDDNQGTVALNSDGSIIAVGAKMHNSGDGNVRVFQYNENNDEWEQLGNEMTGTTFEEFGDAISLNADGTVLAIGGIYYSGTDNGRVQIYEWSGTYWQLIGELIGEAFDYSGCSVSLSADGTKVALGGTSAGGTFESGVVRVFEYSGSGTSWNQIGTDMHGVADERLGNQVALSAGGDTLAVSAYYNDDNGNNCGAVKIYKNNAGTWEQIGSQINGNNPNDWFGYFLSISDDGSKISAGPYQEYYLKVYECNAGTWEQLGSDITGNSCNSAISGDGEILAVTEYNYNSNTGRVETYIFETNTWTPTGRIINGNNSGDYFGNSVALSNNGNRIAGGATCTGSGNPNSNGYAKVFELSNAPSITDNPNDQTNICPNANISFSIAGDNIDTYQWQVNEGSGFNDITDGGVYSNATTETLNITGVTIDMNNYQYQCFVTNDDGNATSEIAILTIDSENPSIICVDNQTRDLQSGETVYTVTGNEFDALTDDNCEIATVTNNINQSETLAGAKFPIGTTIVQWTATDVANNENTCTFEVIVNGSTNIIAQQNKISIYPNPSTGIFNLSAFSKPESVKITDITGKIILNSQFSTLNSQFSLKEKGIYIITIQTKNQIITEKLIIH